MLTTSSYGLFTLKALHYEKVQRKQKELQKTKKPKYIVASPSCGCTKDWKGVSLGCLVWKEFRSSNGYM